MSNQLVTKIDKQFLGRLCADAISELERAARLHPGFPSQLTIVQPEDAAEYLVTLNDLNDNGRGTAMTSFEEEFMDMIVAAGKFGNRAAARIELVQAIATLLRIGCHLDDYIPQEVKP